MDFHARYWCKKFHIVFVFELLAAYYPLSGIFSFTIIYQVSFQLLPLSELSALDLVLIPLPPQVILQVDQEFQGQPFNGGGKR